MIGLGVLVCTRDFFLYGRLMKISETRVGAD